MEVVFVKEFRKVSNYEDNKILLCEDYIERLYILIDELLGIIG